MRVHTTGLAIAWAVAALAATTVSWLGVNLVGDEVSPAGPAALSQAEVQRQIHDAQTAAAQRSAVPPTPGAGAVPRLPTANPPDVTSGAGTGPDRNEAGPSGTSRPTDPGQSGLPGHGGQPGPNSQPGHNGQPGQSPTSSQRSVVTQGGTVVLTCTGHRLTFRASPARGYSLGEEPHRHGAKAEITFTNTTHTSEITTTCTAGILTVDVEEGAATSDD